MGYQGGEAQQHRNWNGKKDDTVETTGQRAERMIQENNRMISKSMGAGGHQMPRRVPAKMNPPQHGGNRSMQPRPRRSSHNPSNKDKPSPIIHRRNSDQVLRSGSSLLPQNVIPRRLSNSLQGECVGISCNEGLGCFSKSLQLHGDRPQQRKSAQDVSNRTGVSSGNDLMPGSVCVGNLCNEGLGCFSESLQLHDERPKQRTSAQDVSNNRSSGLPPTSTSPHATRMTGRELSSSLLTGGISSNTNDRRLPPRGAAPHATTKPRRRDQLSNPLAEGKSLNDAKRVSISLRGEVEERENNRRRRTRDSNESTTEMIQRSYSWDSSTQDEISALLDGELEKSDGRDVVLPSMITQRKNDGGLPDRSKEEMSSGREHKINGAAITVRRDRKSDTAVRDGSKQERSSSRREHKNENAAVTNTSRARKSETDFRHSASFTELTIETFDDGLSAGNSKKSTRTQSSEITFKGFNVSPCVTMAIGACCCFCILVVGAALGFGLHFVLATDREDEGTSSSNGDSGGFNQTHDIGPSTGIELSNDTTIYKQSTGPSMFIGPTSQPSDHASAQPSTQPSIVKSGVPTSTPSESPSAQLTPVPSSVPSSSPSLSMQPSSSPSYSPSFQPTSIPECPVQLLKSVTLGNDNLFTLKYEVVIYPGDATEGLGGLLCVSLEYEGIAGWIGLAFSEASKDPHFGRREAIIGIPGMELNGTASLGQQWSALQEGPAFVNPGKYEIPAGRIEDGFYGPSLHLLMDTDKQTLINGSISTMNTYTGERDIWYTHMSFVKYLKEPEEIEIDPYEDTLLLYAVSPLDSNGEYGGNPEWKYIYLNLLDNDSSDIKPALVRKRKRQHNEINT